MCDDWRRGRVRHLVSTAGGGTGALWQAAAVTPPLPILALTAVARREAFLRAEETARGDALFRDPYARRLAGRDPLSPTPSRRATEAMRDVVAVRIAAMDAMILASVAERGVDAVVNLASGLDTRPYRLPLPPSLRWVELEFPELLDEKGVLLDGERPHCHVEPIGVDLADRPTRRAVLRNVARSARRVVAVTDGVLSHLPRSAVEALAEDLAGIGRIDRWLTDLVSPCDVPREPRRDRPSPATDGHDALFAPDDGARFFLSYGWRVQAWQSTTVATAGFGRMSLASRVASGARSLARFPWGRSTLTESGFASLARICDAVSEE
ncbi:MAG: class I SAM-dependent methyltransferase [Gemmatimonadaceae bacterium]